MRLLLFVLIAFLVPLFSSAQNFEWLQWSPDPGLDSDYDNFNAITTDLNGNSYMAVQFAGVFTIGEFTIESNFVEDICILKYDSTGQFIWAKAMGSLYWDQVNGMDCDEDGNLYITGHYFGVFWYENDSLVGNAGGKEMFLMKIQPDGDVAWAVNGANVWDDEGTDVRAIPGGGVVMSGRANNTSYIGNLQLNNPNLVYQEFIAFFDDNGIGQWIRSCGPTSGASNFYSNATLEIGPDSSIYIGYSGYNEFVFDGDTIRPWYYPEFSANNDLIVQNWSHNGDPIWAWVGGSLGNDLYGDIAVDPQGRLHATLNCTMDIVFNDVNHVVEPGYLSSTVFRWNHDGSEDTLWNSRSSSFTTLQSLTCDAEGHVWAGGTLRDSLYVPNGVVHTGDINQRHGFLLMLDDESFELNRMELITGIGWRTIVGLEYNIATGNIQLGGSATAGPLGPAIFGLGEDIIEGFSSPGNWAYLASFDGQPCSLPFPLSVSDSLLCPNQSAVISYPESVFFPSWNNGSNNESITINSAMDVLFYAIDSTGCIIRSEAVIAQAEATSFQSTVTHLQCNGSGDGSIDIEFISGQEPIDISWTSGQETEDINDLNAGSYTLLAVSAEGCTASQSFLVTQPQVINGTITEAFGVLTLGNLSGGTPPYTFLWSDMDNETGTSVTITEAGNYSVTITDANGCTAVESIMATEIIELAKAYVSISPNPSRGQFNIKTQGHLSDVISSFTIEDGFGKMVAQESVNGPSQVCSLSGSGVYFIRFWDENGNLLRSERVVVIE